MTETGDRRPLASRNTRWAGAIARWMAARAITPNQISQASMVAAALAGGAFFLAGQNMGGVRIACLLLAALFCQLRLLCNLFDGMVAVEGGKGEPDGPFWNEFPDRVADLLIFTGLGYGIGTPGLGWAAGAFAVLTAYVRELGRAIGNPSDFSGPMAKQHRMATVTAAAALSIAEPLWQGHNEVLIIALWLVALGAALTAFRRGRALVRRLKEAGGR
ncbi:CDP-alcohol phosphatidyltransferase family protein [Sinorhizobium terangae]|uniref:CDP-alcohol phosphatidyltransferase family protein n=1 Tax=Sinorhizobium terangae TaxID=110322 RepID=A0A6N7LIW2_SINTE|nr:CDP-alcohol phosphatidyltransferase family protein [Sinorhizobium terangae]MBB4185700.1 phosphatidylglycerophosphate synthase [Sinorhizobium terangae]MQX17566.1 CDP-alcohol phosphatidyltransferase family protein [Sinorhizobium terangae]WFU46243.1 CDP-alcohol phosphatidyltransferase family protein [Sinorhizobium terangae]